MLLPLVDWCFLGWCYCQCVGWCYCQPFMADVIAMCGWCCCHNWLLLYWLMLLPMWWLMFLPYVADGIATLYVMGWCYCPVADVIATWLECGQMLFGQIEWATELIILVLNKDHRRKAKRRQRSTKKNKYEHKAHHPAVGVLLEKHKLCLSRATLWTSRRCSNGVSTQPHCGKHIHGALWNQGPWNSTTPPSIWKRYVDDTFVIQKTTHKEEFFQHLNSIEEKIQFTAENTKADGSLPFLDTLVTVKEDGSLSTSIYRKPTHTNQYLQWDSHHSIVNKFSVINSLIHRANNICSNQEQKKEELTQIEKALTTCKYPSWAIQRVKLKKNIQKQTKEKKTNNSNITNRSSITVPYNQGLSESFKNIGKKYGIQVHFKSGRTIKDELVAPKDRDHITKKSGIIYRFKCDRLECDEEYIGETSRTFGERFREHLKAPSPIHDHSNTSGHTTTLDNFKVVGREEQSLSRLIKESMYIRVNGPSLNKNIGKYHLPHMWNEVLNNSRVLKLK